MRIGPLLVAVALAGCSQILDHAPRSPFEEEADYARTVSAYKELAVAQVKQLKYPGGLIGVEISRLRKSQLVALADWMACVQGAEGGQRRVFAIFYRDRKVADFRSAVVIDRCDQDTFEPLPL